MKKSLDDDNEIKPTLIIIISIKSATHCRIFHEISHIYLKYDEFSRKHKNLIFRAPPKRKPKESQHN